MYSTLKPGTKGRDVVRLIKLLGSAGDIDMKMKYDSLQNLIRLSPVFRKTMDAYEYTEDIEESVKKFQNKINQKSDGIVGLSTWAELLYKDRKKNNPSKEVNKEDYKLFGKLLGVEPESLKAVIQVETGGKSGFLADGRPKILFEAKWMYDLLNKSSKFTRSDIENLMIQYPNIISPKWNKSLYEGGEKEYNRLEEARKIDVDIANQSASWGVMQIMGGNHKTCGCSNVSEFVEKMKSGEFDQFYLGVRFINGKNFARHLMVTPTRSIPDFASFAHGYNGPGYKENQYDTKMKNAYLNFKKNGL